jgi:hypothetical protein
MPDSDPPKPLCEYIRHENGIHEFIIRDSSLDGAYSYLEQIEPIYAARNNDSPVLLVIINSSGEALPMNYHLLQSVKALLDKYPNIGMTYTAILTNDSIAARLADLFIRMVRYPGVTARFFEHTHRDDALQWLLKQR